ncbi:MAG TPA: aldose epimerase [Stenotrophomonas sp.]|nr:aldose epimerase [Stenotrophomonas sp.]
MIDLAMTALPPGERIVLARGDLQVVVAPEEGGRVAQIRQGAMDWLVGPDDGFPAAISWGAYPMVPWAGRIRDGRFLFDGQRWQLPPSLGPHAIHGVAFLRRWQVVERSAASLQLSLALGEDAHWPFGGQVLQTITLEPQRLSLRLQLRAGARAMPRPVLGWHPWFRKLERFEFKPRAYYPRDAEGIASLPLAAPPGPQDDCYLCDTPVVIEREGCRAILRSDSDHWVYYDETPHATCFEPQSGPPDAFNLRAGDVLAPGETVETWFDLDFGRAGGAG